ncbi:MAG: hypothetical protein DMD52_09220 [Gemmatimonadetes bacterium]|nr:MAG: hypothetical protein DMD52_09220 [Gemmatimonadota bacterium]
MTRRATRADKSGVSSTARIRSTTWSWKARVVCCTRSGGRRERCWPAAPHSSTGAACRRAPDSISRRARPVLSSRWLRSTLRRSSIRRCGAAAGSASGLALAACLYGFAGGGLPNIKTVAILPFDNQTPEPALTKEVNDAVLEAFQGRLGLRPAAEANADAVVRGRVVRYESDVPLSFQPGQRPDVTRRQVQITVDVELFDQRDSKTLWQKQGLTVVGEYPPPQEAAGRKVALQKLVNDLVEGAQSQW